MRLLFRTASSKARAKTESRGFARFRVEERPEHGKNFPRACRTEEQFLQPWRIKLESIGVSEGHAWVPMFANALLSKNFCFTDWGGKFRVGTL
jgi:hypothetical protein